MKGNLQVRFLEEGEGAIPSSYSAIARIRAGAPSKTQIRQLVQIQHEERLAATSELNPTPGLVTDRM